MESSISQINDLVTQTKLESNNQSIIHHTINPNNHNVQLTNHPNLQAIHEPVIQHNIRDIFQSEDIPVITYGNLISLRTASQNLTNIINQILSVEQSNILNTKTKATVVNFKIITNEDIDLFIRENCILDEKLCTRMSDLRDAFNTLFNKDISLIAFSKKFNEVSSNYPVERVNVRINSQGGLWIKGISLKS